MRHSESAGRSAAFALPSYDDPRRIRARRSMAYRNRSPHSAGEFRRRSWRMAWLNLQLSAVINDERAHQVEYARGSEKHQSKEVVSRRLDDHTDDDRHDDAPDISGEVHHAAENAGAPPIGQCGRNAPVESGPAQEEQRARKERDRSYGTAGESK